MIALKIVFIPYQLIVFPITQENGKEEFHQKRLLSDTITQLHQEFIKLHGSVAKGLFFSLRPKWIVSPSDEDRQVKYSLSAKNGLSVQVTMGKNVPDL